MHVLIDCKLTLRSDKQSLIWIYIYILNSKLLLSVSVTESNMAHFFRYLDFFYLWKWCLLCAHLCAPRNRVPAEMLALRQLHTRRLIHRFQLSHHWLTVMELIWIHARQLKWIWIKRSGVFSVFVIAFSGHTYIKWAVLQRQQCLCFFKSRAEQLNWV